MPNITDISAIDTKRIVRDITDGIITISRDGTVLQINEAAAGLLGLDRDITGLKYAQIMVSDTRQENDAFHQMIVDSVSDPASLHRKTVSYTRNDGTKSMLEVTSTALLDSEGGSVSGVILSFADRSREYSLKQKIEDSAVLFTFFISVICVWVFIVEVWKALGEPVPGNVMSKLMIFGLFILVVLARQKLHFSIFDAGLSLKNAAKPILTDCVISAVLCLLLAGAKVVIMKIQPGFFDSAKPFVIWDKYPLSEYIIYFVSALIQEIGIRGFVHESMTRILPRKHVAVSSILLSSLMFGALHLHLGLFYMAGAALLLSSMGVIYNRQRNIWGLTIIHYVLGMVIGLLDFVAY